MIKREFIGYYIGLTFLGLILLSCNNNTSEEGGGQTPEDYLEVSVLTTTGHQFIEGFGASDAWSAQFVGKNWPQSKKEEIADLLFSKVMSSDGSPKGIGLNSWRFNIGAGSANQGANSGIDDSWRRAESFMTSTGYDWDAHEGQRWFLQAAKQRGVSHFTAFSNSPPIYLTKNSKAHSSGGASANLSEDKFDAYATFLTDVITNFRDKEGINFNHVSPFNEPQWDWTGGQEGSPWMNDEIASVTRILDQKLLEGNLAIKIELAEAGKLNYLYENADKTGRGSQLNEFFDAGSGNYIGNLQSVPSKIVGHSYYTTHGTNTLLNIRKTLLNELTKTDPLMEFWMTEYCLLENNNEIEGNGRDLGIDPALYLGRVMYADLAVANASHWSWWLAVSPYDYKDGLIYIDNNKQDGLVYDSKILWAMGHYSRFIEEGYQRVDIKRSDSQSVEQSIGGLLISAFKAPDSSKVVMVFVNQRSISIPVKMKIEGKSAYNAKIYQTTASKQDNLSFKKTITNEDQLSIPSRSLVTVVFE